MDLHGGFSIWCVTKAKDLAGALIDPVLVIMNAVFAFNCDIMGVCLGHLFGRDSSVNLVNVHVGWHREVRNGAAIYPEVARYSTSILAGRLSV